MTMPGPDDVQKKTTHGTLVVRLRLRQGYVDYLCAVVYKNCRDFYFVMVCSLKQVTHHITTRLSFSRSSRNKRFITLYRGFEIAKTLFQIIRYYSPKHQVITLSGHCNQGSPALSLVQYFLSSHMCTNSLPAGLTHKLQHQESVPTKTSQPLPKTTMCFGLGPRRHAVHYAPVYGPRPIFVEMRHYHGRHHGHCGPTRGYGYGRPMMGGGGFGMGRRRCY